MEVNLTGLAKLLQSEVNNPESVPPAVRRRHIEIGTDSRQFRPGQVFWAVSGPNFDGHDFVEECFQKGGIAAVVEKEWLEKKGNPIRVYVPVGDTQRALLDLAASYGERFRIPKIAVTGSNGKTTTKDMIAAVLRRAGKTLSTEGNFNNHIGVPLTVFGLRRSHRFAVIEMGTNHPGEIRALSETVRPSLAVVTNIGSSHLEHFGTQTAIRDEKLSVVSGFSRSGPLFLNVDDPLLCDHRPPAGTRLITFGIQRGQVKPDSLGMDPDGCARFRIGRVDFKLSVPGLHNVYNALAALAVGLHLRVPKSEIAQALAGYSGAKHRMQVRRLGPITLLDDCYNANPSSMRAALATLGSYPVKGRRIAVLGDMLELGPDSDRLHAEIGGTLAEMGVEALYTFGNLSRHINQGARDKGFARRSALHFSDIALMNSELASALGAGDVVLLKGSRGMRLERVYESLKARWAGIPQTGGVK